MAQGYGYHRLTERPEGYPDIGYEFEFQYEPSPNSTYRGMSVWTYRVIGWEKQTFEDSERISVRVHPISERIRPCTGFQTCNMGHWHPVFKGDGPKGEAPLIWGFGGRDDLTTVSNDEH